MTPAPKSWPEPGDPRHETAVGAADKTCIPRVTDGGLRPNTATMIAAYHAKLAEQGVVLVDASEVAEWLRHHSPVVHTNAQIIADAFLARFGGGDER